LHYRDCVGITANEALGIRRFYCFKCRSDNADLCIVFRRKAVERRHEDPHKRRRGGHEEEERQVTRVTDRKEDENKKAEVVSGIVSHDLWNLCNNASDGASYSSHSTVLEPFGRQGSYDLMLHYSKISEPYPSDSAGGSRDRTLKDEENALLSNPELPCCTRCGMANHSRTSCRVKNIHCNYCRTDNSHATPACRRLHYGNVIVE
jgi:hypothetical protein